MVGARAERGNADVADAPEGTAAGCPSAIELPA
jgi:hypothetical protein